MKARRIRGISPVPTKFGMLVPKEIGTAPVGMVNVRCPACDNTSFHRWNSKSAPCSKCHNVIIDLRTEDKIMTKSIVLVERYATRLSTNTPDTSVRRWCLINVRNRDMRTYLGISSRSLQPRLNHRPVASRIYYTMLRFVMLNLIATHRPCLVFLERCFLNIEGIQYLQKSSVFNLMFPLHDSNRPAPLNRFNSIFRPASSGPNDISAVRDIIAIYIGLTDTVFGDE